MDARYQNLKKNKKKNVSHEGNSLVQLRKSEIIRIESPIYIFVPSGTISALLSGFGLGHRTIVGCISRNGHQNTSCLSIKSFKCCVRNALRHRLYLAFNPPENKKYKTRRLCNYSLTFFNWKVRNSPLIKGL